MTRTRLGIIAAVSLVATALLSLAVARGFTAYRLERHIIHLFWRPWPGLARWDELASRLATPAIVTVLAVSVIYGALQRVLLRVGVLAACAAVAFFIGEQIAKPAVHVLLYGQLSFPSGNVTAVCATALAMWLALYPVLGTEARVICFALGAAWTVLMSVAVVAAFWHTPLDCLGSILLSIGVVTTGAAVLAKGGTEPEPTPPVDAEPEPVMGSV